MDATKPEPARPRWVINRAARIGRLLALVEEQSIALAIDANTRPEGADLAHAAAELTISARTLRLRLHLVRDRYGVLTKVRKPRPSDE